MIKSGLAATRSQLEAALATNEGDLLEAAIRNAVRSMGNAASPSQHLPKVTAEDAEGFECKRLEWLALLCPTCVQYSVSLVLKLLQ